MKKAFIAITRERGHFRIEVYVDSNVDPATVFGCRESLLPLLAALETGKGYDRAVVPDSTPDAIGVPASIAISLPSGRLIAYGLVLGQDPFTDGV
jgi:hypothetical protein